MAVDRRGRLEADAMQLALVLIAHPEGRRPLAQIVHVERNLARHATDRQVALAPERRGARAFGKAPRERDLGVVLHVEEVRAAKVFVAFGLPRPYARRVDPA